MTPEQINREITEKVMGYIFNRVNWDPYHRIDHAMMALEKFELWTLRKDHGLYQCMVRDKYTHYSEWTVAAPMAICLAALGTKGERG